MECLGEAVPFQPVVCGSVLGAVQAPYLFLQPIRPNLLSVWRESMSGVLVDTKRQPMGSALHYSLMGGACVSDDEMCLRKRSARARGWDLSTAVRPEPECLGPFYACHCHCHSPNSDFRSRTRNPFQ